MWKSGSKVKFTSPSGKESIKAICVTDEGFAAVFDNDREFLFSKSGKPINAEFNSETGGPCISAIKEQNYTNGNNHGTENTPNYKKATINQPWDNIFAIKTLTVDELILLLSELSKMGYGNEKFHLKKFGESANIKDKKKIRKIFLDSKENK